MSWLTVNFKSNSLNTNAKFIGNKQREYTSIKLFKLNIKSKNYLLHTIIHTYMIYMTYTTIHDNNYYFSLCSERNEALQDSFPKLWPTKTGYKIRDFTIFLMQGKKGITLPSWIHNCLSTISSDGHATWLPVAEESALPIGVLPWRKNSTCLSKVSF